MKDKHRGRRVPGNRLFSWMMIGTLFVLLDLAILLYFLWPRPEDPQVQVQNSTSAVHAESRQPTPESESQPGSQGTATK